MTKKLENTLDLYISRNVFERKKVMLIPSYYCPSDGSVVIVTEKSFLQKKSQNSLMKTFESPAYIDELIDSTDADSFYDNYLSCPCEEKQYKERFLKEALTHDNIYAGVFVTSPTYSSNSENLKEAIDVAINKKLVTKESFVIELKKIIKKDGSFSDFDFVMASNLKKAQALCIAIMNNKMKKPLLKVV